MATNFKQLTQVTTKEGIAMYPHLRSTEVYEGIDSGKYTIGLRFEDEKDAQELINKIDMEWERATNSAELQGKRFAKNSYPSLGYRENEEGETVFKFKTNAVIKTKTGDSFEATVAIFDKYGKVMDKDVEVGHGSKVRVCFKMRPFYASSSIYGVQLLIKAVQVIEYVPVGSSCTPQDCGFDVEIAPEDTETVPFEDGADF